MKEIVKHINDTNASYRDPNAGNAKNTDLFLDNEHYELFKNNGEQITVRFHKENLMQAILFISSILPRKFDQSATHRIISFSEIFVKDQLLMLDSLFMENGNSVDTFTQIWNVRKDVPKKNGEIDTRFYFNGLLKDFSYQDYKGEVHVDKFTIRNYLAGGYSNLHIVKCEDDIFDILITNTTTKTDDRQEYDFEVIDNSSYSPHQYFNDYFTALKTKPFLLLAGISGTGKSRLVRELAFATCPDKDDLRSNPTEPGNYCLIDVKPNWHDSSELLGYYSNISGKYDITPFMRFVYKASKHPDVPFFVCLDEMNLAPVEQYFAEFLSKLETRKIKDGVMQPVTLIDKKNFAKCELYKVRQSETDDAPQNRVNLYDQEGGIIMAYLKNDGLLLPYNLYVIGTVNMDDTTHQFSRKVIDRAFTIEMNGGKLEDMFNEADTLEYKDEPIPYDVVKPNFTDAKSALDAMNRSPKTQGYADKIKSKVPEFLDAVNIALDATPFKVSYRVENELILYIASLIANDNSIDIDKAIATASLAILLEKVLPRVEGDDKLLTDPLKKLRGLVQEQFGGLVQDESNGDNQEADIYLLVDKKLDEMQKKLSNSYFTSFFS